MPVISDQELLRRIRQAELGQATVNGYENAFIQLTGGDAFRIRAWVGITQRLFLHADGKWREADFRWREWQAAMSAYNSWVLAQEAEHGD
jgi:hypothetical protein